MVSWCLYSCQLKGMKTMNYWSVLALLLLLTHSEASWIWMGVASSGIRTHSVVPSQCRSVRGLSPQQLRLCMMKPGVIPSVSQGAEIGIHECKQQFLFERWNCTTSDKDPTVFGQVLNTGSKEAAFVHAITSAGVVHAVSRSCSKGNLSDCRCYTRNAEKHTSSSWGMSGCTNSVNYAVWLSETFVDAPEKVDRKPRLTSREMARTLMNLHNNEAGRQAVLSLMREQCRCHGVSSSCTVKTCWRSLPRFGEVGSYLKQQYIDSVYVVYIKRKQKLKRKGRKKVRIHNTSLIHLHASPNYCDRVSGRECRRDSGGRDSCESLCCGNGYNTRTVRETRQCACHFIWCCRVKCNICVNIKDKYTCK